ncbi:MAG: aldehyde dehydrogenase family protein [Acidobacteria bacterium]|nr:MAG: aldehyde dehydrogenase family protein [Acidobacteriota bacterium]
MSTLTATNPRTGAPVGPEFPEASAADIAEAAARSAAAFERWRRVPRRERARALRAAGNALMDARAEILAAVDLEAALGEARINSELARTIWQLHMFADLIDEGAYVEAIIDRANPLVTPPRPELRRMLHPLGPVAIFTPSNFPLAYGVAGGDTASALAAGCPVLVKAHPSQPATSELCARILRAALATTPGGADVLQIVHGRAPETGRAVVEAAEIAAVGFTGSVAAGRALFNIAAARPEPMPFYGELGSLNPIFIGPAALAERSADIAAGLSQSVGLGAGQFCTKPGLVFVPASDAGRRFAQDLADKLDHLPNGVLLNQNISNLLGSHVDVTSHLAGVTRLTRRDNPKAPGFHVAPKLFLTDEATFLATSSVALREEHFGPVSVVVLCEPAHMPAIAGQLGGHLTGTIHASEDDREWAESMADTLALHVGRMIWNGYPTGVAVVPAMQHGGPYPSSTSSLHSAVGTTAIRRFLRPVAYQNYPDALLPDELQSDNPLGIERTIDGQRTRDGF